MPEINSDWCAAAPENGAGLFVAQFHGSAVHESPPGSLVSAPPGNASSIHTVTAGGTDCCCGGGLSAFPKSSRMTCCMDRSGYLAQTSAQAPATCGAAIEVP